MLGKEAKSSPLTKTLGNLHAPFTEEKPMRYLFLTLLLITVSCGKFRIFKKSSQQKQDISQLYASGTLKISVFYEQGAEPFTDGIPGLAGVKVWTVLEQNLKAMFPGKTIYVPKDLAEMAQLSDQNQTTWSYAEMNILGEAMGQPSTTDTTVLNIFFVKGHSEGSNGAQVIGLHISGTKTLMIFKETVESSDASPVVKRYVEQSTLVHEVGHAVGLVNNGLPMISSHEDTTHQAHCNNPNCVMYWENEGASALKTFISGRASNPSLVMFDSACLKDVTSHK